MIMGNDEIIRGFVIDWVFAQHEVYFTDIPNAPKSEGIESYKEWSKEVGRLQDAKMMFNQFVKYSNIGEAIPSKGQTEYIKLESENILEIHKERFLEDIERIKTYGNDLAVSQKIKSLKGYYESNILIEEIERLKVGQPLLIYKHDNHSAKGFEVREYVELFGMVRIWQFIDQYEKNFEAEPIKEVVIEPTPSVSNSKELSKTKEKQGVKIRWISDKQVLYWLFSALRQDGLIKSTYPDIAQIIYQSFEDMPSVATIETQLKKISTETSSIPRKVKHVDELILILKQLKIKELEEKIILV
jgi:hypothetical protein